MYGLAVALVSILEDNSEGSCEQEITAVNINQIRSRPDKVIIEFIKKRGYLISDAIIIISYRRI
jgi:hypothetical protein